MTAPTPLILKGQFLLGATDVSDEVTHSKLIVNVATIQVPATLATPHVNKGGAASYSIEINYLATDGTDGVLFPLLWAALATATHELAFTAYMRDGVASVSNPKYTGTLIVAGVDVGSDINTLSQGSTTFPLTAAWTKALA